MSPISKNTSSQNRKGIIRYIRPAGLASSFRQIYYDYRSVLFFGLGLSAAVVLSYWLSRYIPVDFFREDLLQMMHAAVLMAAIWGGGSLLMHHEGIRARRLMAYVFLAWAAMELIVIVQNFISDDPIIVHGVHRMTAQSMLVGNVCAWLLLIYPTEALRPGWLNLWRALLLLSPVLVLALMYYSTSVDLRLLMALYPVFIFFVVLRNLDMYRRWCEENFSSLDDIDVQWIWKYLVMLLIVGASYLYICVTKHPTRSFTQMWLLLFLIMYTTDHVLLRRDPWQMVQQSDLTLQIMAQAKENEEQEAKNPTEDAAKQTSEYHKYKRKIDAWMADEKPYINKDLRLTDLMKVVPLNRSYLSQLINTEYNCNFYQFVTSYRIAEAMRLMTKHPEMKLQDVAERSGFSSPTVFSRTFVREVGVTPTAWAGKNLPV